MICVEHGEWQGSFRCPKCTDPRTPLGGDVVRIHRAELRAIHDRLKECRDRLQAGGERHSWLGPYIDIARERASAQSETRPKLVVGDELCEPCGRQALGIVERCDLSGCPWRKLEALQSAEQRGAEPGQPEPRGTNQSSDKHGESEPIMDEEITANTKPIRSLAGEAIELTISLLREIARRSPDVLQHTDIEAFILNELNPAKVMADKDRTSCSGLLTLLAKARRERNTAQSAIAHCKYPEECRHFGKCIRPGDHDKPPRCHPAVERSATGRPLEYVSNGVKR